jgi:prepilin-type N-terminal cleavage/methylation domain-containing protein
MTAQLAHGTGQRQARGGFTLIELLVVVVIIGILVTLAVPYLTDARVRARETQTATNLTEIRKALESCGTDNNGLYPFRIRWFDTATVNMLDFDPYRATDTGTGLTSDAPNWCSLGLLGGVRVVEDNFSPNITDTAVIQQEHIVVQPHGFDANFYRQFNQFSDPLVALGYLTAYPANPFFKRPMGNVAWTLGSKNWLNNGPVELDKTIPGEDVVPTPGDFVYTFFYNGVGDQLIDPPGVVECKKSYQAKSPSAVHSGLYYLDMVDSYQLWAYGNLPMNGAMYVAYPNNSLGLSSRGNQEANKDFDNSGTKDLFELGMIVYYKNVGSGAGQTVDNSGQKVEF